MPAASAITANKVEPGLRASTRTPWLRSRVTISGSITAKTNRRGDYFRSIGSNRPIWPTKSVASDSLKYSQNFCVINTIWRDIGNHSACRVSSNSNFAKKGKTRALALEPTNGSLRCPFPNTDPPRFHCGDPPGRTVRRRRWRFHTRLFPTTQTVRSDPAVAIVRQSHLTSIDRESSGITSR